MAIAPRPAKLRPVRSDCQRAKSQQTQRQKKRKSASVHMVQSFAECEERAFVVFHDRRVMCQLRQVNDARFCSEDPKRIRGLPGFDAITPRSTSLILAVKACVMDRKKTHPNSTRSVTSGALRVLSACLRHVASNPALQSLGCCFETIRGNSASNRGRVSKSQMHPLQMLLEPVSEAGQNGKIGKSRVAARTSQGDLRGAALPVSVQSNRGGEGKRVPFAGP